MLNPFRYVRSIPLDDADNSSAFDRLATILPVFHDTGVTSQQSDRLAFRTTGFRGAFRTIGSGTFRITSSPSGRQLNVSLRLRPFQGIIVAGLSAYIVYLTGEPRRAWDMASVLFIVTIYGGLSYFTMRGEAARWTRQVCAAALARPPEDITLDPADPADHNTVTAPELSSARV